MIFNIQLPYSGTTMINEVQHNHKVVYLCFEIEVESCQIYAVAIPVPDLEY